MATSAPPRSSSGSPKGASSSGESSLAGADEPDQQSDDPAKQDALERPVSARIMIASSALTILSVLLLGFVLQLVVISRLEHYRSQRVAYAEYRNELAQGVAPVGDLDNNGKPLAMGAPVATLEIPSIGVREVVGQGTTSSALMKGPGHRRDSVLPGQAGVSVIMGRRAAYGGPFAKLNSLKVGATIIVTTGQGVSHFAVLDVRTKGDPSPPALTSGEGRLLLMTATGAAYVPADVLRVDARLTSPVQPAPAISITSAQLPSAEKVLHGEPSAWLGVVLWGQALLIAVIAVVWARPRWGFWQAWLVGVPVLALLGLAVDENLIRLLPNVL